MDTSAPGIDIDLQQILTSQGIDPLSLLQEAHDPDDSAVLNDQALSGEKGEEEFKISEDEKTDLSEYLAQILELYDQSMIERRQSEEEIEDFYALRPDPNSSGIAPDSEQMVSELLMLLVDQAQARIAANLTSVDPIMKVTAIDGTDPDDILSNEFAESTERFLQEYSMREMDLKKLLPLAVLRLCKVGTAVLMPEWRTKNETIYYYDKDGNTIRDQVERGFVNLDLVPNRNVVVWPPNILDWQREYEFVGHRTYYSIPRWRTKAISDWSLTDEQIDAVEAAEGGGGAVDQAGEKVQESAGIHTRSLNDFLGTVKITNLYCDLIVPGRLTPDKFQVIFHEASKQILWIDYNRLHNQKHPYYPIRYKLVDESAWGDGIGHEVIYCQAEDSALRNLQLDNLMSTAFWVVLCRAGTMAESIRDRVMPGQMIPVDNVNDDFKPTKMGEELEQLESARNRVSAGAREATGLSSVLAGQGDSVMKSGAGTGSTVALIEQAGKKFGQVDGTIRADLSAFYMHVLELVAQYATEGVYYRYASKGDATRLSMLQYVPPRKRISDLFHIWAQAPDASNSEEARKNQYMLIWQFAMQHTQQLTQMGMQILQQNNPAAVPRFMEGIVTFLNSIAEKIVESSHLPGLVAAMPQLPEMTPEDQQINQLMQQTQQDQQQIQQLTEELQKAQQAQDAPKESISYKDLPPDGQIQMAAQAGIQLGGPQSPVQQMPPAQPQDAPGGPNGQNAGQTSGQPQGGQ